MKSTIRLIAFGLLIHPFSFGQTVDTYGPFPKIPANQFNFSYLTESLILLNQYDIIGGYSSSRKTNWYYSIDLKQNASINSKNIKGSTYSKPGSVFKVFFTDEYIIEFIDFAAGATSNVGIGALKRNPYTLEVIGDLKIIDEKFQYSSSNPNASVQQTSKGYVYTRVIDNHCVVSYLDVDFNELKTITLQDEPADTKTTLLFTHPFIKVNDKDELILTKLVNISKTGSFSDFHVTTVSPDGEVVNIKSNLEKKLPIQNISINYSSDNASFEGIIFWSIPPVMKGTKIDQASKSGYQYFILDENGNKLVDYSKEFTLEEVCSGYKDALSKKYSEKKLENDILPNYASSLILSSDQESYLIINNLTWTPELMKSTFIVKIDKNGNQAWSKMLHSKTSNKVTNFGLTPNQDLRILLADFSSTNQDGEHNPDIFGKQNSKEPISFFEIIIGKKYGELTKNSLLNLNIPDNSKLISLSHPSKDANKYLLEYLLNDKEFFSIVSF